MSATAFSSQLVSRFASLGASRKSVQKIKRFGKEEISIYYDTEAIKEEFNGVCKELKLIGLKFYLYDLLMGYWERRSDRDLLNFIDDSHAVKNVIELGVGTGYLLRRMAGKYPNARIRGSDLSISMLQVSKEKLIKHGYPPDGIKVVAEPCAADSGETYRGENIILAQEDCRRVNAPDASQDMIISSYLLDLLPPAQILEVLSEARRLLRPGGKAYLMTLTSDVEKGDGLFGRLKEFHFRMRNGFYALYYHSTFLRKISHTLFEGYYTHCRPIDLSSYIMQCENMIETRTRQSYVRICGVPYLPVKIVEVTRI